MSSNAQEVDSIEDLLITLDQVQQTIEVMSLVVERLRQQINNNHEREIDALMAMEDLPNSIH